MSENGPREEDTDDFRPSQPRRRARRRCGLFRSLCTAVHPAADCRCVRRQRAPSRLGDHRDDARGRPYRPVAGALADAFGRKRLIAAGALAMVVPMTLAALAATFPELLIWRAVAGLLMPLIFCVAVAYIGEEWDADEARAMTALYMAGAVAGGFFGRFFTGVMTDALGWRVAFAGVGAVNLAIGLALLVTLPRERSFVASSGMRTALTRMLAHLRRPHMLAACVVGSLILFAQVALFTYANFLLADPPYGLRPGLLASISAVYLLGMVSTPFAGGYLRDFREGRVPLSTGAALFIAGAGLT